MDLGVEEKTMCKMANESREDPLLPVKNEEIEEDPEEIVQFEECFVAGVPEEYPDHSDNESGPEEVTNCHALYPNSFADQGIASKLGNVNMDANSHGYVPKGLGFKGQASYLRKTKRKGLDINVMTPSVATLCPIEFVDTRDCEAEEKSFAQFSSIMITPSQNKTLVLVAKNVPNKPARKQRRLPNLKINNSDTLLADNDKIRMVNNEEQMKAQPSALSTARKRRKSDKTQRFDESVTPSGENLLDDKDRAKVILADNERSEHLFESVNATPSMLERALMLNIPQPYEIGNLLAARAKNGNSEGSFCVLSCEGTEPQHRNAERSSKLYNKINDLVLVLAPEELALCENVPMITTKLSATTCEGIAPATPHSKRPSIIGGSSRVDLEGKNVPFIENDKDLKAVKEDGLLQAKRAKTERRKQVIVFKQDVFDEIDMTVSDSEEENVLTIYDSDDETREMLTDSESEMEQTDTDDETKILYENYGNECYICCETFSSESELTLHMETHKLTQCFQCVECDLTFKTELDMECHACEG